MHHIQTYYSEKTETAISARPGEYKFESLLSQNLTNHLSGSKNFTLPDKSKIPLMARTLLTFPVAQSSVIKQRAIDQVVSYGSAKLEDRFVDGVKAHRRVAVAVAASAFSLHVSRKREHPGNCQSSKSSQLLGVFSHCPLR